MDLTAWDMKSARAALFAREHEHYVPFSTFAEEATEIVDPRLAPDKLWPVYGVNNQDGVFLSHRQRGSDFNSSHKRIKEDWFFHNPTRANVGSLGRVSDVSEDALTSPEYQVWRLRKNMLPEFAEILISMPFFVELIQHHRVGAVKQRLYVENLLNIPVPLVPLARQRAIAERWRAAQGAVEAAGERIAGIERETQARFLADLGLILPERSTPPKAFALKWQDLERWSVMFNQLATVGVDVSTGKYPVAALGEIAAVSYGIQKCPANRPGQHARPYLRVANVQRGQLDLSEIKYINVPDSEMPSLRLEPGDLLVCEGNSADLVGRPAIWRGEIADCVHQNHILKVRLDRARALPEFVLEYMSSYPARNHFRARAKFTTNLASINSNDLRELSVSLPPLSVQRAIMERVEAGRAKIAREREAADRLRRETQAEVEAMILGAKPVEPQT